MRMRVRVPFRTEDPPQSPSRSRRDRRRARTNPFSAEETALPGHLLVLLSRLHRVEGEAASPSPPASDLR
ncbi:hypothetical protein GMJLKIPL_0032 [Methylobacterium isbiliense]|jgi:hypothetical protein|uniref:Uncharacterized protein n=1 Tax=Methylobacterium isbiliense TaxID=315478 RepID=A0ABQ4S6N8_9HYPH|nr:hypothetical protein GMJLKIPL_0032 [Methylobacterium isbiliense]